ncbi:MAG TPA: SpoIIE family protein phosphatase [Solirubrobacterales bacterium]|jgi:serine phosphatase RsbU (regulator of sigma subunit)/ketosteroid isomerase-like protein|nr:SpoIIE family protein phosphatase [Solirubrobacterales bacterium]
MPLYADVIVASALVVVAIVATISTRKVRQVNRRFRMLDEISRAADAGESLDETLEAIAGIIVPELGDICAIDVIEDDSVRRAALHADGPDGEMIVERLKARGPRLQEQIASDASRERQEPRRFELRTDEDLREFASDDEDLEFLRSLGVRNGVTVELRARGRPTGMLTISVGHSGRRFQDSDIGFVTVLAGRVALALDNAGLFSDLERSERERAEIAETLQRGLLPPPLPHIPGWSVAATYRPAGAENEIGGDFYDAFRIAGGWMVVIGDVTGRGAKAAAVTAHARYTLRTAAALTGDPVVALRTLNRELLARQGTALCSVAAMAFSEDPDEPVRLAVAGHPPPLLVDGDRVTEVTSPAPVLGAFTDESWALESTRVAPGQQLVVVTDGVTEMVGEGERFGEERLSAQLVGVGSPALAAQRIEGALHEFAGDTLDDDAAILAVAPAAAGVELASDRERELVERLYEAFNRRDSDEIVALCDESMGFFPVGTAEELGRTAPYVGPQGLREYLLDVDRAWDELLISPKVVEKRGSSLLVRGRAYARSRHLGIRDLPVAWIWDLSGDQFTRGEVFRDLEEAAARLATTS